jgi:ribosomal protein S14
MAGIYEAEANPGHKLQILFREMFPFSAESQPSFLSRIDDTLEANGELSELAYDSTINYMTRRLITTAKFLKRRVEADGLPDSVFADRLRNFVENEISLPKGKRELVFTLLFECARVSGRNSSERLSRMKRTAIREGRDLRCYFCGIATNLVEDNKHDSPTLDHVWPNSLGGTNSDPNFRVICFNCNNSKATFIDASDFHYEEICLSLGKEDTHFSNEMKRQYEVAIWAKSAFECTRCGKAAVYMGKLQFSRRSVRDSWHFLNIDAYCQEHARE